MRTRVSAVTLVAGVVVIFALALGAGVPEASVVTSCPPRDQTLPNTTVAGADRALVPSGATGVLLCRYRGLNPYGKRLRLLASRALSAASKVAHLAAELNALPKAVGVIACPLDDGSRIVAYFRYPGGTDDVVSIGTSGCATVTNGHLRRTAALARGVALLHELETLTR